MKGVNPVPRIRNIQHKGKTLAIIVVKALSDNALEESRLASLDGDCFKSKNGDSIKIKGTNIGSYCKEVLKERIEMQSNEEKINP